MYLRAYSQVTTTTQKNLYTHSSPYLLVLPKKGSNTQDLKRIIVSAIAVLDRTERGRLFRLILGSAFVSIADIASLALLLVLVKFYSQNGGEASSVVGKFLAQLHRLHLLLPLILFLLLFILKNLIAYLATRAQYGFIYEVASRISRRNMLRYLNGSYRDYTQVNPAVHISCQRSCSSCHFPGKAASSDDRPS